MAELSLYIIADDVLDTASKLEVRHDLEDFVKENKGKYKIRLYDGKGEIEDIIVLNDPMIIDYP